ncbi:MAG TPA: hypothetical protein VIV58_13855, partial [Kofleriaceae bacterium]
DDERGDGETPHEPETIAQCRLTLASPGKVLTRQRVAGRLAIMKMRATGVPAPYPPPLPEFANTVRGCGMVVA